MHYMMLEDLCLEQKRKESERERQRKIEYRTSKSSYLVKKLVHKFFLWALNRFVIFTNALFEVDAYF